MATYRIRHHALAQHVHARAQETQLRTPTFFLSTVKVDFVAVSVTATKRPELVAEKNWLSAYEMLQAVVTAVSHDHLGDGYFGLKISNC